MFRHQEWRPDWMVPLPVDKLHHFLGSLNWKGNLCNILQTSQTSQTPARKQLHVPLSVRRDQQRVQGGPQAAGAREAAMCPSLNDLISPDQQASRLGSGTQTFPFLLIHLINPSPSSRYSLAFARRPQQGDTMSCVLALPHTGSAGGRLLTMSSDT